MSSVSLILEGWSGAAALQPDENGCMDVVSSKTPPGEAESEQASRTNKNDASTAFLSGLELDGAGCTVPQPVTASFHGLPSKIRFPAFHCLKRRLCLSLGWSRLEFLQTTGRLARQCPISGSCRGGKNTGPASYSNEAQANFHGHAER